MLRGIPGLKEDEEEEERERERESLLIMNHSLLSELKSLRVGCFCCNLSDETIVDGMIIALLVDDKES